ncbi:MAG: exopolysaccharide biosynthesis polyprenyl glycosylphosphotransferase [Acidobacteria bacterium]|nr:exopolysaccharide biosynthesis polyprenyl glycosylphosphotransferase [Acidobacteriota bacterium]MYH23131.1 exopolysaccharide biosynthesis polyprenyl glycosylphosphotransferase [Acidobacteriota bacterium]
MGATRRPFRGWRLAVSPAVPSAEEASSPVSSSTALGASDIEAGGVRSSWLERLRRRPLARRLILDAGDAGVACGAVVGALWSWSVRDGVALTWSYLWEHAVWVVLAGVWMLLLRAVSAARLAFSTRDTAAVVARAVLVGFGLYLVLYFLAPRDLLPRLVILDFLTFVGLATLVWRVAHRRLVGAETPETTVAVVGAGQAARDIAALLSERAPHRKVLGLFPSRAAEPGEEPDASLAALQAAVTGRRVSALILAPERPMGPELLRTVVEARERDIEIIPMHTVYEQLLRRLPIRHKDPSWVIEALGDARRATRSPSWLLKRAVDVAGGAVGCAALLLALPVLGPLVWLDVGWPVFFRQERLGLAGRRFLILKFRTMGLDAEADGARWAGARDQRASGFGRFLRRSRLDELPQFWNVLRGEMSLVGPRPERPEFVAELVRRIPSYRERLLVRPGISGWAQVNYRYGGSVDGALDKLEYDLYYIKHRDFWLDASIIWRTIGTVLSFGGR